MYGGTALASPHTPNLSAMDAAAAAQSNTDAPERGYFRPGIRNREPSTTLHRPGTATTMPLSNTARVRSNTSAMSGAGSKGPGGSGAGVSSTGLIRLTLKKPMGIVFEPMEDPHNPSQQRGVRICDLPRTGAAAMSGQLEIGDELLSINSKTMSRLTFDDIMDFIIEADADNVNLLFRRPKKEGNKFNPASESAKKGSNVKWVDVKDEKVEEVPEPEPDQDTVGEESLSIRSSSPPTKKRGSGRKDKRSKEQVISPPNRDEESLYSGDETFYTETTEFTEETGRKKRGGRNKRKVEESFLDMLIDSICAPVMGDKRDRDEYSDDDETYTSGNDDETLGTYDDESYVENKKKKWNERRRKEKARDKGRLEKKKNEKKGEGIEEDDSKENRMFQANTSKSKSKSSSSEEPTLQDDYDDEQEDEDEDRSKLTPTEQNPPPPPPPPPAAYGKEESNFQMNQNRNSSRNNMDVGMGMGNMNNITSNMNNMMNNLNMGMNNMGIGMNNMNNNISMNNMGMNNMGMNNNMNNNMNTNMGMENTGMEPQNRFEPNLAPHKNEISEESLIPDPNCPIAELEYDDQPADVSVMDSIGGPSLLLENLRNASKIVKTVTPEVIQKFGATYPQELGLTREESIQIDPNKFYRWTVKNLLEAHEPEKVRLIEKLFEKYKGREEHLIHKLSARYADDEEKSKKTDLKSKSSDDGEDYDGFKAFGGDFSKSSSSTKEEQSKATYEEQSKATFEEQSKTTFDNSGWPSTIGEEEGDEDEETLEEENTLNESNDEEMPSIDLSQQSEDYSESDYESIDGTSPEVIAQVSELLNYVYGKTSVPGQIDRVSTIMRAYEGRTAVLLELLETKALLKANADTENAEEIPDSLLTNPALKTQQQKIGEKKDIQIQDGANGEPMMSPISNLTGGSISRADNRTEKAQTFSPKHSEEMHSHYKSSEDKYSQDEQNTRNSFDPSVIGNSEMPSYSSSSHEASFDKKKKKKGIFGGMFKKKKGKKDSKGAFPSSDGGVKTPRSNKKGALLG